MDSSVKVHFSGRSGAELEVLVGLLSSFPVDGLEEVENGIIAYFPERVWDHIIEARVEELAASTGSTVEIGVVPFENWNQTWETDYAEVEIDTICRIYAPFHEPARKKFENEIKIMPQMAFGTGHHETTEMMIRILHGIREKIVRHSVLDFGSGSGVLAIYAYLLGASPVVANEIDRYAFENLKDNIEINHAGTIEVFCGGQESLPKGIQYDVIAANITRNVILDHLPYFVRSLATGGSIVISGILSTDFEFVKSEFEKVGLRPGTYLTKGKWLAAHFIKELP
ncbi:50S ribosomal protein L11 methyltransferase [Membranihabitans maritimus]|uniref:50S ribosomal protein L11 methyltransferase n=1 Tax=Membranihabitans maritimus TaxID=2904244 RepID=UPI001F000EBC|nr:50S ribosomal protein L11 methyltransferase [Membranihabitans maritimus]